VVRDLYIGLDLGTSSLKGVVVSAAGEIVGRAQARYPTVRDAPGQAEQDPGDWIKAVRQVARRLAADAPPARWRAIGLSAMIPTLVVAGADGAPAGLAVTWEDARAEAQGASFRTAAAAALDGDAELYRRTGQRVDGRYLLPMVMRLRESGPESTTAGVRIMGAKDYLFWWLTGDWATDPSTASGVGCYDLAAGAWLPEVAAIAGAAELPAVMPSTTLRPLTATAAARTGLPAGLPVCLGAADSVAGMLALGATAPGDIAYITGTSTVIAGVSKEFVTDAEARCLVTPLATGDGWGLEMDLVSTGSAVSWLARLLRLGRGGEGKLMELAAAAGAGDAEPPDVATRQNDPPLFLPFLGRGEQGALWDPDLRGAVVGLDLAHSSADLALALMDGIVIESCRCLDVLEKNGLPPAPVRASGAGVASVFFRRRLADASTRDVLSPRDPERPVSALGAALLARTALDGAPEDPAAWTGPMERTASDRSRRACWKRRRRQHDDTVACLSELHRRRR